MERVARGRSFTLSQSFYSDGALVTPTGMPTVAITRADGTSLATSAVAGTGTGPYTTTVAAAVNTLLDTLTVVWTATISGQANTYTDTVEVAGGFLFSIADARAVGLALATYPTADVTDMRTTVEQTIEQACGCAFVPRYRTQLLDGTGGATIVLDRPFVTAIRSVTISGIAFTAPELAALAIQPSGLVYTTSHAWGTTPFSITVGYEHGLQDTPAEIRRAALLLAKDWMIGRNSPVDDRATTFGADNGISYSLAVAGRGGSHVGLPDVDAAIDRWAMVAGIA